MMKWLFAVVFWVAWVGSVSVFAQLPVTLVPVRVNNIAQLIATPPPSSRTAMTLGYWEQGDGGGGLYRWTNSLPVNVVTNTGSWFAGTTGFWSLVHDGKVNVRQFGAKGDGVTDDFFSLVAAAESVTENNGPHTIEYPPGVYAYATAGDFIIYGPSVHRGLGDAWIKLLAGSTSGQVVKIIDVSSGSLIENLHIDGSDINGQNGYGIADGATDIIIRSCEVKNFAHGTFPEGLGGGRGFTAQHAVGGGCRRILIDGCTVRNAFQAYDVSGRIDPSAIVQDQPGEGVRVVNSYAENCQVLISVQARNNTTFPQLPQTLSAIFANIQGFNVGHNTSYPTNRTLTVTSWSGTNITVSSASFLVWGDAVTFSDSFGNVVAGTTYYIRNVTSNTEFSLSESDSPGVSAFDVGGPGTGSINMDVALYYSAPIRFDRACNAILDNIQIYNDPTNYPRIDSIILGKARYVTANVTFYGPLKTVFDGRTWSENTTWAPQSVGVNDCNFTAHVYSEPWTVVVSEDGSNKYTRNHVTAYIPSIRWGLVDKGASLQTATVADIWQQSSSKRRAGSLAQVYDKWNDFSNESGVSWWNGTMRLGLFDISIAQGTNTAFGGLYHSGNVYIRRNAIDQIAMEDGRVRFPSSAWDGGRLLQYGTTRFFVDSDTVKFRTGADPSSSADGRVMAAKTQINNRNTSTTFRVFTHAPVQIFTSTSDITVTMSTDDALGGDTASIVRPGTEAFTVDVGPGLKTIPVSTAATVDLIFDGANWIVWRYSTH